MKKINEKKYSLREIIEAVLGIAVFVILSLVIAKCALYGLTKELYGETIAVFPIFK